MLRQPEECPPGLSAEVDQKFGQNEVWTLYVWIPLDEKDKTSEGGMYIYCEEIFENIWTS